MTTNLTAFLRHPNSLSPTALSCISKPEFLIGRLRSPVVLVCWPLTLRPQKCLSPRWARIFFSRSKSSRSLESTPLESIWEFLPSTISFCLFRNQVGILNWVGFCMIVMRRSSSSELSSPALKNYKQQKCTTKWHSPLVKINISLFTDQVWVSTPDTFDLSQSVHDLALSINIGVQQTKYVLVRWSKSRLYKKRRRITWNCWWGSGTTRDMLSYSYKKQLVIRHTRSTSIEKGVYWYTSRHWGSQNPAWPAQRGGCSFILPALFYKSWGGVCVLTAKTNVGW